MFMLETIFV